MALTIEQDHNRFRQIVKGRIKKDLKKYVSNNELIGRKGDKLVSIPIPRIETPKFVYSPKKQGGVGQGEGDAGASVDPNKQGEGGNAGNRPGHHIVEVEISLDELAEILAEELELPNIKPRGESNIVAERDRYTGIHSSGPESLRHFKRTYKQALKRQISSGTYNPKNPVILPIREDRRYLSWKTINKPITNAVIFYLMDVSGSMGNEQKEIVRTESFWIDTWLQSQYDGIENRYIIHDATAQEVDSETFYHTRESGGTIISSAYKLCHKIIVDEYPPNDWNMYVFHFSDGDNWSSEDTNQCLQLLKSEILPMVNLFCYGQVESQYGSGQFLKDLKAQLESVDNVALSNIASKEDILGSIKNFLGKGK